MRNTNMMVGSICLSDIPKSMIKAGNNGKLYLSISVHALNEKSQYGDTHLVKCSIKNGDEWQDAIIGNLEEREPKRMTNEDVQAAPVASEEATEDLPF